jgi:hypothetical protein
VFCDRCGQPESSSSSDSSSDAGSGQAPDHTACQSGRALEPPRYCAQCARRMVVQVLPTGWTARCVEHGTSTNVLA